MILSIAPAVLPQAATSGSISGTVKDESGAVIPGAEVRIVNLGTTAVRTVISDDSGFFTTPNLSPGRYSLEISFTGFRTGRVELELNVRDNLSASIVLEPGAPSEVVTVEAANVSRLELRSGEVGNLISGVQVTELPLNGRNFAQFTLLVPGVSVDNRANTRNTGLLSSIGMSVSGSPSNANMWLVDGANNVDIGSGLTILVTPSVDSIAEFRVQRNSYGAEMGASSGAQINVITKGGTNDFHGTAYEFFRSDALNATDFFINTVPRLNGQRVVEKAPLTYSNFGYTLGGPILKDRLFFFWSQEWRRERRGVSRNSQVPTALEREGDFSGPRTNGFPLPIDPYTGEPFPNNRIPADRLSPFALAFMKLYPLPTPGAGTIVDGNYTTPNWIAAPKIPLNTRQEQIRVDYTLAQRHSLMGRFTRDYWANLAPSYLEGGLWGDDPYPAVDSNWVQPGYSLAAQWTATLGENTINQFQFSWSGNRITVARGAGADINDAIVAAQPEVYPGPEGHGHTAWWRPPAGSSEIIWTQGPWDNIQDLYVWKNDFSKVHGNHSLKAGFLYSRNKKNEDILGSSYAHAPFFFGSEAIPGPEGLGGGWGPYGPGNGAGQVTTNGLADMLLRGTVWFSSENSTNPRANMRWRDLELYFSDTWRVTPRLTATYGLRWSYLPNAWDAEDRIGNFVMSLYDPKAGATPTNGMIWPNDLRGIDVGRGLVKNHRTNFGPRLGIAWDPTGQGKWAIRSGFGVFFNRESVADTHTRAVNPPFVQRITTVRTLDTLPRPEHLGDPSVGVAANSVSIGGETPTSYQWNLTVERELFREAKLEVAYVANVGRHLPGVMDLNQVPLAGRLQYARWTYDNDPDTNQDSLHALYPLKGTDPLWQSVRGFTSSYHSLQVYLVRRFFNSLSYQASYTFSKSISTGNLQDGFDSAISDNLNLGYDKALAGIDRPHIFTANAIYRTPVLSGWNRFIKGILGDWQGNVIVTATSGVPLTLHCCAALSGNVEYNRPDQIRNPNRGPKTVDEWFDTSAFVVPEDLGRLGRSARGQVRSPGIHNWDLGIHKNFAGLPWFGKERAALQFRAEMFNAWNHTQYHRVDTSFENGNTIRVDLDTNKVTDWRQTNPNFGRVTRMRDPREFQFALKIIW